MTIAWVVVLITLLISFKNARANDLTVDQIGDSFTLNVEQDGGSYGKITGNGDGNSITLKQQNVTDTADYQWGEVDIEGDDNTVTALQTDSDNKYGTLDINGDGAEVTAVQKGSGPHTGTMTLNGNDHTAVVIQEGSGNHTGTITLNNGGGGYSVYLNQDSSTDQSYTFNGTCYTSTGCSALITQN